MTLLGRLSVCVCVCVCLGEGREIVRERDVWFLRTKGLITEGFPMKVKSTSSEQVMWRGYLLVIELIEAVREIYRHVSWVSIDNRTDRGGREGRGLSSVSALKGKLFAVRQRERRALFSFNTDGYFSALINRR